MESVVVSTDGSCLSRNNEGNGAIGWALVEHSKDATPFQRFGGACFGTNQIAELSAVLIALRTYRPDSKRRAKNLTIQTDSQYSISASTDWLPGWKRNGWKRSGNKPLQNAQIIKAISEELDFRRENGGTVEFVWVKGHFGDKYNEIADELANTEAHRWQELLGTDNENDFSKIPREAVEVIKNRSDLGFVDTANQFDLGI